MPTPKRVPLEVAYAQAHDDTNALRALGRQGGLIAAQKRRAKKEMENAIRIELALRELDEAEAREQAEHNRIAWDDDYRH